MQERAPDGEMSDYVEYLQRAFAGANKDGQDLSELFNEDVSDSNWKQTELLLNKLEQQDTRSVIEYLMRTPIGRLCREDNDGTAYKAVCNLEHIV